MHLACICIAEQPEFPRVVRRRACRFTFQEMPLLPKRWPTARGPLRQKRPGEMRWPPPGAFRRWSQVNPEGGVATVSEAAGRPAWGCRRAPRRARDREPHFSLPALGAVELPCLLWVGRDPWNMGVHPKLEQL